MSRYIGGIISKTGILPTSSSASGIWNLSEQARFVKARRWPGQGLYVFESFSFTHVGLSGATGPTRSQCLASYNTTLYPWISDTAFFNVTTTGIQTWTCPISGIYQIECYGAQGGTGNDTGGLGGYSKGNIILTTGQLVNIVVGQTTINLSGGWGGGGSTNVRGLGGGGGTDVRINGNALTDRIIVAGGGGGSAVYNVTYDVFPGAGGGLEGTGGHSGTNGSALAFTGGGGTQTAGGIAGSGNLPGATAGGLGVGGNATGGGGGGGGGYYGGGSGAEQTAGANFGSGGGGGSGYIGGVTDGTMNTGIRTGPGLVTITLL